MPERHFNEDEIAAIFERASEAQKSAKHRAHGAGLTLAELQEIGAASGIAPEFIAKAAAGVDHSVKVLPRKKHLGIPIGVRRTVDLPGPLSDDAWDHLVVTLRDTFQASGKVSGSGGLREWRNGNLYAIVEPASGGGYRLRMGSTHANLQGMAWAGTTMPITLLFMLTVFALDGTPLDTMLSVASFLGLLTAAFLGTAAVQGPQWAATRERQMEAVAARAVELATPTPAALPTADRAARISLDDLPETNGEPLHASLRERSRG